MYVMLYAKNTLLETNKINKKKIRPICTHTKTVRLVQKHIKENANQ